MPVFAREEDKGREIADSGPFLFVPGGQFHAGHRKQISRIRVLCFTKNTVYFMQKHQRFRKFKII